jgi:beta-glucuronidase
MDFIETNEYFGTWAKGTAADAGKHLDALHAAFPNKAIVISEYGYCACTKDRPEGDGPRIETLRTHDAAFRSRPFVGGAIFFCYNDYRTQVGDRGFGALQQRVHGVVDVYGARKPSYEVLRAESSPVESLTVEKNATGFRLRLRTRATLPAYTLRGYKLRGILYGQGDIPVEALESGVPDLAPGQSADLPLKFRATDVPIRIRFDVMRPTGCSAYSVEWKPPAA